MLYLSRFPREVEVPSAGHSHVGPLRGSANRVEATRVVTRPTDAAGHGSVTLGGNRKSVNKSVDWSRGRALLSAPIAVSHGVLF